jgi:hypothetical protein
MQLMSDAAAMSQAHSMNEYYAYKKAYTPPMPTVHTQPPSLQSPGPSPAELKNRENATLYEQKLTLTRAIAADVDKKLACAEKADLAALPPCLK